jgi:hypothetical protein
MAISSFDDFPVHQTSEYVRFPATSDRNFYDRYYFNCHDRDGTIFAIFGIGQYPNLGTTDAFACVTDGVQHRVVRASRPLVDRMQIGVGPIDVEVLDPLRRLHVTCDGPEHGLTLDLTWDAAIPAFEEPRQYLRSMGKVVFDTQRFAQLGRWTGTITLGDETFEVTPDRWSGSRDRSWGVRPVGEPESDGIRQGVHVMGGMWNYFPTLFDDHAIVYMLHETNEGERRLEEAVRVWSDPTRGIDHLGRPEHSHRLHPGTRVLAGSTISLPAAGIELQCSPLLANYLCIGTGYGLDADWRHGMYHGPELVVHGRQWAVEEIKGLGQYGVVDQVGRMTYTDDRGTHTGVGLYEHGFFGAYERYGLTDAAAVAP